MVKKQTKPAKNSVVKKSTPKSTKKSSKQNTVLNLLMRPWYWVRFQVTTLLRRRPHRSFRLTRKRDYKRSFAMPGYWSFTNQVRAVLWKNWRLFGGLVLVYIVATIVISGFGAQEAYNNLSHTLKATSGDLFAGNFGSIGQAGLLLISSVTTGLSPNMSQAQSVLGGLALFFAWLTTIWLLRNTLAGHHPKLRDGLYNSGSPVLASVLVGFIITLQLLPAAVAVIVYSAAQTSGLMEGGVAAMLVWSSVALLGLLSLYWVTSSFIAMVIVALPGMYPWHAIRSSGDLVVGRRLRIVLRMAWLAFIVMLTWALVVIPVILFNDWLTQMVPSISWLPLVPLVIIGMGSLTIVYVAAYIYLMYRRIVDDDAAPA